MAIRMGGSNKTAMSEINVTPLVDVMLVLLIIFMVTAPMMQEGISVSLPEAKSTALSQEKEVRRLFITVAGPGKIFVNEAPVEEDKLAQTIIEAKKQDPSVQVFLRADKSVPYGAVVRVYGELTSSGVTDLNVVTTSPKGSSGEP
jgi:biopolymer transport protein TolR